MSGSEDAMSAVIREVIPVIRTLHAAVNELPISDGVRDELNNLIEAMNDSIIKGKPHTWGM